MIDLKQTDMLHEQVTIPLRSGVARDSHILSYSGCLMDRHLIESGKSKISTAPEINIDAIILSNSGCRDLYKDAPTEIYHINSTAARMTFSFKSMYL